VRALHRVQYLPLAERDLFDILDLIARDRPHGVQTFVDRLDRTIGRLARFPRPGPQPNDSRLRRLGYRMLVVDNYLVFYVIVGRTVEIRRVLHGARRYEFLLPGD
jgi:plasmid stabilization system protein ParE